MYITLDILKKYIDESELINLTDDNNSFSINEEIINEIIVSAESEINSYLNDLYPMPLVQPIPKLIEQICIDITIYNLYKRRKRLDMPGSINQL